MSHNYHSGITQMHKFHIFAVFTEILSKLQLHKIERHLAQRILDTNHRSHLANTKYIQHFEAKSQMSYLSLVRTGKKLGLTFVLDHGTEIV